MDKALFESFCGRGYPAPYSRGEYSYATDGRYLVRVKRLDEYAEKTTMPDAEDIFKFGYSNFTAVVPLDSIEIDPGLCPVCKGDSKPKECPECFGAGVVEFDTEYNDYEVMCKTCDGGGQVNSCKKCEGTGIDSSAKTEVAGTNFMSSLLYNVKKLPSCQLKISSDEAHPSVFTFDGGDGLIMCLKK